MQINDAMLISNLFRRQWRMVSMMPPSFPTRVPNPQDPYNIRADEIYYPQLMKLRNTVIGSTITH